MLSANLDEVADNRGRGSSNMTAATGVAQTYAIMDDRDSFQRFIAQSDPELPKPSSLKQPVNPFSCCRQQADLPMPARC